MINLGTTIITREQRVLGIYPHHHGLLPYVMKDEYGT
jgi:hypothetical protein